MPFQPINFANIAPQGNPVMRDFAENLMQSIQGGMQLRNLPGQMQRQREEQELNNQFKRFQNQGAEESFNPALKAQRLAEQYIKMQNGGGEQQQQQEMGPQAQQPTQLSPQQKLATRLYKSFAGIPDSAEEVAAQQAQADEREFKNFSNKEGLKFKNDSERDRAKENFELKKLGIQNQNAQSLELFKNKIKQQFENNDFKLTPSMKTDLQTKITAVDRLVPQIEKLRDFDVPSQGFKWLSPQKQRDYKAMVADITEGFIKAKGLNGTVEAIQMVKDEIFGKGYGDTDDSYRARLDKQIHELSGIRDYSSETLGQGKVKQSAPKNKEDDSKGITRVYKNGVPYDIPNDKLDKALKSGYSKG